MRVDRPNRARVPGRLAMIFNLLALVTIFGLLAIGEPSLRSAGAAVMRVAGFQVSASGGGVSVDSSGKIRYRSRPVTLEDLGAAIEQSIGADAVLTVQTDASADATLVARVLRVAGRAGAQTVRLSVKRE